MTIALDDPELAQKWCKLGTPPGLDKTLSELTDVSACYDTNWGVTPDAIDIEKIPDIKVDQDLADALTTERFLTVAGQKADQNITGSPMPFQTSTRLIETKAQDAGPGPDEEF